MLESIRRSSRSTIIYVLFGVLIAVFIINFGPGSQGGCTKSFSSSYAVRVGSSVVSEQDFRAAFIEAGGGSIPPAYVRRVKSFVMDKLIERELLAQEAERLGFAVADKEVEDLLATGRMYVLSVPRRADEYLFQNGAFDYKRFQNYVENRLGLHVQRFIDVQRREMLADRLKQQLLWSIKVTPAEAQQDYLQKETQSNLEFVRFSPRQFEAQVTVTPEEIAAYQQKHTDEIKKQFDERSFLYKKVDRQARLKLVLVEVAKDEADAEKVKKAERKAARAKSLVEQNGAAGFAQVARELSDDESSKARGGDLGWRKKGFTGLGKEIDDKAFAAKKGDVIGPVRTERGFELVEVEGFREGDIPLEQVAPEIAEDRLRADKAKALAREAAGDAVRKATAGKSLAELFPKPATEDADPARKALAAPAAEETGMFQRRGELVPQVGVSADVMKAAFASKVGQAAGPFDVTDTWVVVRVKEHRDADLKYFEEHKEEELRQLQRQKWADVLDDYAKQRCIAARDGHAIDANQDMLSTDSGEGGAEAKYVPCGNPL